MSALSLISVALEGIVLICQVPISVGVCKASGANPADSLFVKVRTPTLKENSGKQ